MKKFILIVFILSAFTGLKAQQNDLALLAGRNFQKPEYEYKRKVEYLFKGRNWLVKYNPLSLFFGGAMLLYQSTVSVQIGANCPYEVSCSAFSKSCITKYGIIKGIALSADRLTRCTRLAAIDLDDDVDWTLNTHKIIDDPKNYKLK
ncbi:MAG: membrane protein insertion efficiency factor YidD [Bacteroidia bacterium]